MRAFVLLIPALLSAADITSVPNPIALRLEFHATGATSQALSVSCSGYSRFTTLSPVSSSLIAPLRQNAVTRFEGANPNCTPRAEAPFPVRRVSSLPGVPESFVQYRRVVLQNVWPGVDVAYEVDGWHGRLTFLLESAASASAIRLPTGASVSNPSLPPVDFRLFAQGLSASVRAEKQTPHGPVPTPVVCNEDSFDLPARPSGSVHIILEAQFVPEPLYNRPFFAPDGSIRSVVGRDGSLYESAGSLLRKFSPSGRLLYESQFAGVRIDAILLSNTVDLVGSNSRGIITRARIDPESGRFLSIVTYNGLSGATKKVLFADDGGLLMIVETTTSSFPRRGPPIEKSCFAYVSNFPERIPSRTCHFAVRISPEGDLLTSQQLPHDDAALVPDGSLVFLSNTQPGSLERRSSSGITTIPRPGPSGLPTLFSGLDSTVWYLVSGRLFRLPRDGTAFQEVAGVSGVNVVLAQEGGDVLVTGTSVATLGADPLMDSPCPFDSQVLAHIDSSGVIRYATYLPDLNPPPSLAAVPALIGRKIAWLRDTLDPDAPPRPAFACTKSILQAFPGHMAFLEVRGVPDESPFFTSWADMDALPTNVRGWSVRLDGIPAPILELNRRRLAIIVPPSIASGKVPYSGTAEFFYQGRNVQSSIFRLAPPSQKLLTGRLGPFDYTISNQFGPLTASTNWPTAGEEVRMFVYGSSPYPPHIYYATGQPIPVSTFRMPPGHPPGVYELRFVLPPPPAGPPPNNIYIPELGLSIKVYFK